MMRRIAFIVAGILIVSGCRERMDRGWDWNRMRAQPYQRSYDSSAWFTNGMAMQLPPPGTVPHRDGSGPSRPDIATGAERFQIFCALCHGMKADGNSIAAVNMDPPKPPTLVDATTRWTEAHLDSVIRFGHGVMPALGASLDQDDRRAIVAYLRTLRGAP